MSGEGWAKLLTTDNLQFLARGLVVTLVVTLLSGAISTVFGLALGTYRSLATGWARMPATLFIEAFRNVPVLVLVFFIRFGPPAYGLSLGAITSAVIGLSLYGGAMCAEIFRAGIESVPRGQLTAARSSGMSLPQAYRYVVLPQGWQYALPSYVGQLIVLLQGTTLVSAIGVLELTGAAQVLYNRYANPLETLTVLAAAYFALDYALSAGRSRLERDQTLRRAHRAVAVARPQ